MTGPYKAPRVTPVVSTADATLKSTGGEIYWITISNTHATAATAVELDNGGTDVWGVTVETSVDRDVLPFHAIFDPPIYCDTSIILDITGGTVKCTVGLR